MANSICVKIVNFSNIFRVQKSDCKCYLDYSRLLKFSEKEFKFNFDFFLQKLFITLHFIL